MARLCMSSLCLLPLLFLVPVQAFIGLGIDMYNPSCAYACRSVMGNALIACPSNPNVTGAAITPACRAVSAPFLTTLAYCIKDRCYPAFNPTREKVESYWSAQATGDDDVPPQWGWQEAYDHVNGAPTAMYDAKARMTGTVLVGKTEWMTAKLKMDDSERQQTLYARYTLIIFLVGVGIPIVFTAFSYLPYSSIISHWVKPRLIYPSLLHRHVEPVFRLFHIPTLGQSFYIASLSIITFTLTLVDYGNLFSTRSSTEADVLNYLGMRTGIISLALLPLTVLFAGRNNVLLYISNWSHSTYLLLHRWVARLCLVIIILHSLIEFVRYSLQGRYGAELAKPFVQWGIVGTVACAIMILSAQFRRYSYEIFLISHIILAIIFIAGTWYHLELQFFRARGYQQWIYLCSAIWFFDRVVRLGRVLKCGVRSATITPIGDEVVRVDIEGVRWSATPGQHAYLFLPAIRKWAPWENHPFSVIPTSLLTPLSNEKRSIEENDNENEKKSRPSSPTASGSGSGSGSGASSPRSESSPNLLTLSSPSSTSGVTVYIKRNKGITAQLHNHPHPTLRALMDGPYRNTSSRPVLATDRLILFAGGIGITGVLPFVHAHPNVKVYWSVRPGQAALVDELEPTLPGHVERSILVGGRNSIEDALMAEVKGGWGLVGVVVCGPGKMCDEVRNRVAGLGRKTSTKWELDVEAFLW